MIGIEQLPSKECSAYDFLRACNKSRMGFVALNYFGKQISFAKMVANIDRVAVSLKKMGVSKDDIVTVCGLNTPEFIYLFYAINKVGAVSNMISPASSAEDLHDQIAATESKYLFVVETAFDLVKEAIQGIEIKCFVSIPIDLSMPKLLRFLYKMKNRGTKGTLHWNEFIHAAGKDSIEAVYNANGSEIAVIEYTGGSTGVPKGGMLTNSNLNAYFINFYGVNQIGLVNMNPGESFLACVPIFLAFGLSAAICGPLCNGMSLVLVPDPSPTSVGNIILRMKPNHIMAGRVQIDGFKKVAAHKKNNLSFIRSIMYGGESVNLVWERDIKEELSKYCMNAPIRNGYGMTETSASILFPSDKMKDGFFPGMNVDVKVVDPEDDSIELGYNSEGELCLCADTIIKGYYNKPIETSECFREEAGVRWLKTGDLAKIYDDGTVSITGRIKRVYHKLTSDKVGIRVYPMRIEKILSEDPGVEKCAVFGVADSETAFRTIACIKLKENSPEESEEEARLTELCNKKLPESHFPDQFIFVPEIPLTRANKIDYLALTEKYRG